MHKLVHTNQYGFLKAKSIQDHEYVHQCSQSGGKCVILKFDFEKVFDMLEHNKTIKEILIAKHFGSKGIQWCPND